MWWLTNMNTSLIITVTDYKTVSRVSFFISWTNEWKLMAAWPNRKETNLYSMYLKIFKLKCELHMCSHWAKISKCIRVVFNLVHWSTDPPDPAVELWSHNTPVDSPVVTTAFNKQGPKEVTSSLWGCFPSLSFCKLKETVGNFTDLLNWHQQELFQWPLPAHRDTFSHCTVFPSISSCCKVSSLCWSHCSDSVVEAPSCSPFTFPLVCKPTSQQICLL